MVFNVKKEAIDYFLLHASINLPALQITIFTITLARTLVQATARGCQK